jgi:hypothetical protein
VKGIVHRYFSDIKMGTIRADNGKKYPFTQTDWMSGDADPEAGVNVLFDVEPGRAVNVRAFQKIQKQNPQ